MSRLVASCLFLILFSASHCLAQYKSGASAAAGSAYTKPVSQMRTALIHPAVFDANFYLQRHVDLQQAFGGLAPAEKHYALIEHWVTFGIKEGRAAHPNFTARTYLESYADLRNAFGTSCSAAIEHYVVHGLRENRSDVNVHPSVFNPLAYLNSPYNQDLRPNLTALFSPTSESQLQWLAGIHFTQFGISEMRYPGTPFNIAQSLAAHPGMTPHQVIRDHVLRQPAMLHCSE